MHTRLLLDAQMLIHVVIVYSFEFECAKANLTFDSEVETWRSIVAQSKLFSNFNTSLLNQS